MARSRRRTSSRRAERLTSADDLPGPGRTADDHDQSRRPGPRLPARRARPRRTTTGSSPGTRGSSRATTCGSTAAGRSSSARRRSSSSRRASSSRTTRWSTPSAPVAAPVAGPAPGPDGRRRRPRGLRPRQLRGAARPPDDRDRDPVGLRRHLRRQAGPARPPRRAEHPLVPLATRAAHDLREPRLPARAGRRRRARVVAAPVRQRPARVRRDDPAQGRLAHLPEVAAGHPVEAAPRHAGLQRGRRAAAQGRRAAPAERQRRDAEPDRRSSVGPGGPRPRGAAARGPHRSSAACSSRPPACRGS